MLGSRLTRLCLVLIWRHVFPLRDRKGQEGLSAPTPGQEGHVDFASLLQVDFGLRTDISGLRNGKVATPEAIAVMGQQLQKDGSPTPVLERRVGEAASIFKDLSGQAPVICSGGDPHRRGVTEAEVMHGMLVDLDVPDDKILKETSSANTVQNALYVLKMIGPSCKKLHLVTSDFHMPRCAYIYEAVLKSQQREDIKLVLHPVHGGCPDASTEEEKDQSDGSYETVNDMTKLERLQLEKKFLANEEQYLKKDSPEGVTVPPLPQGRLKKAQDEVERMLAAEEGKLAQSS